MAKKKKKVYHWKDVIHRMKNSYYVNKWGMYQGEIEAINIALAGRIIKDRDILMMLKNFNFDVEKNLARLESDSTC